MSDRVLIVEDVATVCPAATTALRRQGFLVTCVGIGSDLARTLDQVGPQVVILNPEHQSSAEPLRLIRRHSRAAVLLVVSRGVSQGEVRAADECLRRPFTMVDLIARVRTLARRGTRPLPSLDVGGLHIAARATSVTHEGREVGLTRTERKLLGVLAAHCGRTVSKKDLLAAVWGLESGDPNLVEVNVSTLRRKLERHVPRVVHTIRGQGYRLGDPL